MAAEKEGRYWNLVAQQRLPHIFTRHYILTLSLLFAAIAVVFVTLGAALTVYSDSVTELSLRYDHISRYKYLVGPAGAHAVNYTFNGTAYSTGVHTRLEFTLAKSLTAPVFIQYRLHHFYQNFHPYGTSFDSSQLMGRRAKIDDACEPYRYPGEANGVDVPGYYSPCGSMAWSMFNDTFSLYQANGTLICDGTQFTADGDALLAGNQCSKRGIAYHSDMRHRFVAPRPSDHAGPMWTHDGDATASDPFLRGGYYYGEPGHRIPNPHDEDFAVWVNQAYFNDFVKMYRRVNVDLPAGNYYFDIVELYDTQSVGATKAVGLATRSWMGGRNHVLGILFVVVGSASFVCLVAFLLLRFFATTVYFEGE